MFTRARLTILMFAVPLIATAMFAQSAPDEVTKAASEWLKGSAAGDRTQLNAIMDPKFIATTPGGDVLTKERLVPDEADKPVQKLPPMDLQAPLVRIYGSTAILMSRLTSQGGPEMNGTFVFSKESSGWKLVGLHLSPHK